VADKNHEHQRVEVKSWCPDCGKELGHETFNRADMQAQQASELPDREAMSSSMRTSRRQLMPPWR